MKNLQRDSIDFGTTRIPQLFRGMFYPTLLSMVFMSLLTVADGIFVGQGVGSDALAAINIVAPLFLLTTGLSLMFGVGVSVVASIHLSKGNIKAANINITQALEVASVVMGIIVLLIWLFKEGFLRLLGCSDSLMPLAMAYMLPLLPGCIMMVVETVGSFIIRLDASPVYASLVGIIPGALNIFLDWMFVFPMQMGIKGSSLATTICCALGTVMVMVYIIFRSKTLHLYALKLTRTSLYLTLRNTSYMIRSGFSSLLGELAMAFTMLTGNYVIIKNLGEDGVAAFSVACYLYPIVFMVNNAVAQSAQPIISFNYGAGNKERVSEAKRVSIRTSLLCGVIAFLVLALGAHPLVGMFLDRDSIPYAIATSGLQLFAGAAVFFSLNIALIGYYQAIEKSIRATVFMMLRGLVILVPAFIFLPMLLGTPGFWLAVPTTELLTFLLILLI